MLDRLKKVVSLQRESKGLVAQLDRVPDYGSGGCGFDSRLVHKKPANAGFFVSKLKTSNSKLYTLISTVLAAFPRFVTCICAGIRSLRLST